MENESAEFDSTAVISMLDELRTLSYGRRYSTSILLSPGETSESRQMTLDLTTESEHAFSDPSTASDVQNTQRDPSASSVSTGKTSVRKSEPLSVTRMLNDFRPLSTTQKKYPQKLNLRDMSLAKRKLIPCEELSPSPGKKYRDETSPTVPKESPWESRRIRADLAVAKAQITDLETTIKRLHVLRKEMETTFESEKQLLQTQQATDRCKILELENHLEAIRMREEEAMEEYSEYKKSMNTKVNNLERSNNSLKSENKELKDKIQEFEFDVQANIKANERQMMQLKHELKNTKQQIADMSERNTSLEEKLQEFKNMQNKLKNAEDNLQLANSKIKDLQREQESYQETLAYAKSQEQKLLAFPSLEKEAASLKEENKRLRNAVQNKLLLEEMVADLKQRQERADERERELVRVQASCETLQHRLQEWEALGQEVCGPAESESSASATTPMAEKVRSVVRALQQRELSLKSENGSLSTELKALQLKFDSVVSELDKIKADTAKNQTEAEQQTLLIRRLQKKLLLVSGERDSYRSQLDSYENELTFCASPSTMSRTQQQANRIEVLQKTLDGYKDLVERLEAEVANFQDGGGGGQLSVKLQKLESECESLKKEKEALQKRRDELEIELEYRALKGDFNPMTTKVLHLRSNPSDEMHNKRTEELSNLQVECERLRERVRVLEAGQAVNVTQIVEENVAGSKEVKELREQLTSYQLKMQRMKEAFTSSGQEFREACYVLLGYKIDRIQQNHYRLASMYADSQDDHLMFKMKSDDSLDLLETAFSSSLPDFIQENLHIHHSVPLYLSGITQYLFNRQTLMTTTS
ncbi:mitotic spindle assembly checkpoint protein MAD1 [Schistocerca americana]|uniref:mitotic spindle assembly checkpoint protein MAD1 n=1 Tax=Schistocerca americana TaxID=7009 RepID=UPI001F4FCC8B|nr:mitotic spindle assembly checkpoint protein MAD1 [Schistocerca americana]XP_049938390.1 mitotic spindle assembly checkpoint protein MAD1 [Schistocerca serialis cubense]